MPSSKLFDDDDTPATALREREPAKPGTPASLMGGAHVAVALGALRKGNKLNGWERDFLASMVHAKNLSPRQLEKLQLIAAKAALPIPRLPKRRRGRRQ